MTRKLKNNNKKEIKQENIDNNSFFMQDEQRTLKILLLLSWVLPFISLFFIHITKIKLPHKPKVIMCKILNLNFTVILIMFILISLLQPLALAKVNSSIIYSFIFTFVFVFLYGLISHIIATIKWLSGDDYSFKYSAKFFEVQ